LRKRVPSKQLLFVCCTALFVGTASADPSPSEESAGWLERATTSLKETWNEGTAEVYVPLFTWHLPWAYTQQQIDEYNSFPLGLGVGRGRYTEDWDWHGFYAMGFQDSHSKPQYQVGYGYKTFWPVSADLKAGIGYTVFIGARSNWHNYTPFPAVLPIISLEYAKTVSLDAAYVPGGNGNGNVLFIWTKFHL
jgi:palmitoyl transferase